MVVFPLRGARALDGLGDDGVCDDRAEVFVVGVRYPHHARHSGYDGFALHVGEQIAAPVRVRRSSGAVGEAVDRGLAKAVGHPRYSVALLRAELAVGTHMLRRSGAVYHFFYGERDLLLLRRFAGLRGHRLMATFHGPLGLPPRRLEWVSRRLDALVLVSEYQRRYFEHLLPPERIHVVPHGMDTNFFRPAPELATAPVCISVGTHQRDYATLARAMELVWPVCPAARLVLVGLEARHLPTLRDNPRVEVLPVLSDEDLRSAYQGARLAVFPFTNATASNAMLEAMACGLPVVATDVGGVPEYLPPGAGRLCPRGDARAMADAMLGILEDTARADAMAVASRAAAEARDYRIVARALAEVYDRVLLDHRPDEKGALSR